jgi:ATP-dependent DNA helicase RecQ
MHENQPTILQILKKYWGYDTFRSMQEEIITSVLAGKDTLALLPTGGGKSICFQVPALAKEGLCIVVSPLIALMKDQVENLKKRGIPAVAIYSGMHRKEIDILLDNCVYGNIKFLYLSPERLRTELFIERLKRMKVNLLAVDEAHCISQWGYDFRPPYLQIAEVRQFLSNVPVLALTATATPQVQQDIQEKLRFRENNIFRKSFARANLSYSVLLEEDKEQKLLQILKAISGTAIVYVRSRRRTQEIAQFLAKNAISSTFYHAGLDHAQRNIRQENWIKNQTRVIVATNAFGMGIDKPDVRVVIHLDVPDNLEAYYQEAGRAGRDELKSYGVLLYQSSDIQDLQERFEQQFPDIEFIKKIYQALANHFQLATGSGEMASYDFDLEHFQQKYGLPAYVTYFGLKRLEDSGLIQFNESFYQPSRIHILLEGTELYKYRVANARFDNFLQTLLRMYGGELYSGFMNISEEEISRKCQITLAETERSLLYLHQSGVIFYEKQKEKPQITFLTPRFEINRLPLDISDFLFRKNIALQRLQAMTNYVVTNDRCRTLMFQDYFGEKSDIDCGVCDVCVKRKKMLTQTDKYQYYRTYILQLVNQESLSLQQLYNAIPKASQSEFSETIKTMLGNSELVYEPDGKLKKR